MVTDVSVVLPVWNGAATIQPQLAALLRQQTTRSWELIVCDNGSTDDTAGIVRAHLQSFPNARLLDASQLRGAGFAKNRGASVAKGEIVLFCDADDEVDEAWIESLSSAVVASGFAGGALDRRRLHAGHAPGPGRPLTDNLHLTKDGRTFAVGANMGMTAALFRSLGGFDASFLGGNEDADIALRAAQLGFPPVFCAEAVVHYRDRATARATFQQYRHYGRTEAQLHLKHRVESSNAQLLGGLQIWGRLVRLATRVARPHERVLACRLAGRAAGRVEGSIRNRALFW